MKRYFLTVLVIFVSLTVFAKKVKFAVNMAGQTINSTGIHVSGDFQVLAGFPGDNWDSGSTTLAKEGTTDIYSVVVTVPAFRKYEYKFVNGDQFYEAEFVPEISRVGYDFNDNRWIYVDSLSPDTFFVGAIRFGENAPTGFKMVRLKIDMNYVANPSNVHVAGSFNGWNYQQVILYSFVEKLYEVIQFVPAGNFEYRFANGSTSGNAESIPVSCSSGGGNRSVNLQSDSVLEAFCFGSCVACVTPVSKNIAEEELAKIFPNPADHGKAELRLKSAVRSFRIFDGKGALIHSGSVESASMFPIDNLEPGLYQVQVFSKDQFQLLRLVSQ